MRQLSVISVMAGVVCLVSGCGMRFAATEAQKENAWLHQRVCAMAADTAADENASAKVCGLTELAQAQSEAFVMDYGLPEARGQRAEDRGQNTEGEFSVGIAQPTDAVLEEWTAVAEAARADAARRPDMWTVADGALELGIALAGLVGGVYGVRAVGFLKTAREKSTALKEIIAGNELFKQLCPEQTERFKKAQARQSAATRQIVAKEKAVSI
jgi:hypothetical protein